MAKKPPRLTITKLMTETMLGNVETVCNYIATYGLPRNSKFISDYSILQVAMLNRHKEIIDQLLQHNCSVNGNTEKFDSTPLYLAVEQQDRRLVELLLQKGAIIDRRNNKGLSTPVHLAITTRQYNILYTLLNYNTDVNLVDTKNRTVLQILLEQIVYEDKEKERLHPNIIQKLVLKQASVNCKGQNEQTPLHLAANMKQKDILPILLQANNANVNLTDSKGNTVLHSLLSTVYGNVYSRYEEKNLEIAKTLLQLGAKIDEVNKVGQTPLHVAAGNKHFKILALLLESTRVVKDINACDNKGKTILHRLLDNLESVGNNLMSDYKCLIRRLVTLNARVDIKCKTGETAIHLAAKNSSLDIFWTLLPHVTDINVCDDKRNTILHFLVHNPKLKINALKLLVKKGLQVNTPNYFERTPLHIAAINKRLDIMPTLLKSDIDLNTADIIKQTVLHMLLENATGEELKVVNELLSKGAAVDCVDREGFTPMHMAAKNNQKKILLMMLEKCTQGNKVINSQNSTFKTLLHMVLQNVINSKEIVDQITCNVVKMLLSKGAFIDIMAGNMPLHLVKEINNSNLTEIFVQFSTSSNIFGNEGKSLSYFLDEYNTTSIKDSEEKLIELIEILLRNGVKIESERSLFKTSFEMAIKHKHKKLTQVLLKYAKDLTKLHDSFGNTILHNFLLHADEPNADTIKLIISKGAPVDATNINDKTALHLAAEKKNLEVIEVILQFTLYVNATDDHGNNVLHILLENKDDDETNVKQILSMFLSKGVTVDKKNDSGITPMHLACKNRMTSILKILLESGADPQACDKFGKTGIHIMSESDEGKTITKEKEVLRLMQRYGCDINAKDIVEGRTSLHIAAECGNINVVKTLIEHGADVNCTKAYNGSMPLHLAAEYNHIEIVQLLLKSGVDINVRQGDGQTALHLSTRHNDTILMGKLLESGADVELRDRLGRTALLYACWYENIGGIDCLLDYGADVNASDADGRTPLCHVLKPNDIDLAATMMIYRVMQLKAAGLSLNEKNCKALDKCNLRAETREFMVALYRSELDLMKKITLDSRTTLYDVLHMSANKLAVYQNNKVFKKLLSYMNWREKFVRYGSLIIACQRRGKMRSNLLKAAKPSLHRLAQISMPDGCSEKIFDYLENESLRHLIKAGSFKVKKRKINVIETEVGMITRSKRRLNS